MRKIYFIGTLHAGLTNKKELQEILIKLRPGQLLVEIQQKDILTKNYSNYPDEMVFAYTWALRNQIPVLGFDSDIDVFAENMTKDDNDKVIQKQSKIISQYSWKDFNKEEYSRMLDDVPGVKELVNEEQEKLREQDMLKNIQENAISDSKVVILTGAGHLSFFEKELPGAIFPLRH